MRAVIFDLDGTLVDSGGNIAASINYARSAKGLSPLGENEIIEKISALTFRSAKALYGENASESDHQVFEEHYAKSCLRGLSLYNGVGELLRRLRERGFDMAIATNATSGFAKTMIAHLGFAEYFKAIVGADMVKNPKPAPDMLNLALKTLAADPSEAVFVGDSGKDMKSAKSAGIAGVFASWGYGVENALAVETISDPMELLAVLDRAKTRGV